MARPTQERSTALVPVSVPPPADEPAPLDEFLNCMRRGQAAPKVKVRAD